MTFTLFGIVAHTWYNQCDKRDITASKLDSYLLQWQRTSVWSSCSIQPFAVNLVTFLISFSLLRLSESMQGASLLGIQSNQFFHVSGQLKHSLTNKLQAAFSALFEHQPEIYVDYATSNQWVENH